MESGYCCGERGVGKGRKASVYVPEGFGIHPKLQRHVKGRLGSSEQGKGIDCATAEAMAFETLLLEGNHVRISGQVVRRGTFSQCHAILVDQKDERTVVPLDDMLEGAEGKIESANSTYVSKIPSSCLWSKQLIYIYMSI